MIVDACRARRASNSGCDVAVLEPLLNPKQKDFSLQARQPLESGLEQPPRLVRREFASRVRSVGNIMVLDRDERSPLVLPEAVLEEVAGDPEEPSPKRPVTSPPIESPERLEERVLDQVIHLGAPSSGCAEIPAEGCRVTLDQLSSRHLVAAPPRRYKFRVGQGDSLMAGLHRNDVAAIVALTFETGNDGNGSRSNGRM
jgi:hypothetical protein